MRDVSRTESRRAAVSPLRPFPCRIGHRLFSRDLSALIRCPLAHTAPGGSFVSPAGATPMATLDPDALQVETMSMSRLQPSPAPITDAPPTQRTFERDCTMPGLCPESW